MKRLLVLFIILTSFVGGVFLLRANPVLADDMTEKQAEIEALKAKLTEIQGQKQTLSKTIDYLNTKIQLTQKQISASEAEIAGLEEEVLALSGKIVILDSNLEKLSALLVNRIHSTYIKAVSTQPMYLFLTSDGFSDFLKRYKYLRVGQKHDKEVMFTLEQARTNFDEQKQMKEKKQADLEIANKKLVSQKSSLDQQQREKQTLLQVTKNDEKKYQSDLAQAMAELDAIQGIIAGMGTETEVKQVNEGDAIASIISGASACSSGTHLHFEVHKDQRRINPAEILSSKSIVWDNKPDGTFGFSGSWRWPIDEPVRITQGYGMTFYAGTLRYYGGSPHTGIDMVNDNGNNTIKSVKAGKLFRGGIACGKGTLRYVRVQQDSGYDAYYLHVNY